MQSTRQNNNPKITVADFIEQISDELPIEILAGTSGARRREITSARIQKLGLALAGFARYIHPGRVQFVGQSEISYLNHLGSDEKIRAIRHLDLENICCILTAENLDLPEEFLEIAERFELPVLRCAPLGSQAVDIVSLYLRETLAPCETLHGVLIGMYGIGVLITGESGIGKSECALELIQRGHNLISDDTVIVKRIGEKIQGTSPDLTREHLEIRGLGIINVRDLFGVVAVGKRKKQIDLCVELKKWSELEEIERLGLDAKEEDVLGVKLTKFVLPVSTGRNTSTLVETAIRLYLSRLAGFDAAGDLVERHSRELLGSAKD